MKVKDLIQLRLVNQGLTSAQFDTCADVVSHFGAMQAQDYAMAKWAIGSRMRKASDSDMEKCINSGSITRTHILRPTWHFVSSKDIHLNEAKGNEREVKGSRSTVLILALAAIVTLVIAFVNFVNLATARALERAKEVSIRKTAGANKRMLVNQFLLESLTLNAVSFVGAIIICWSLHPHFQSLAQTNIEFFQYNATELLTLAGIVIAMSLISGLYPAIVLSSFDPVTALKGKISRHGRGKLIRKSLVVFQFTISVILISVSIIVSRQVAYMQNKSTGINTEQTLVLKIPARTEGYNEKLESLRNQLKNLANVASVTISNSIAGNEVGMNLANRRADAETDETNLFEMLRTDPEFIETFKLQLLHGRNFSRDIKSDAQAVIANEEAVKLLGYKTTESALNQEVYLETSDKKFTIIGIAKNYHQTSLRDNYKPILFFTSPDFGWIPYSYVSLKLTAANWSEAIADVRTQWDSIFPESSFDYFFLDEHVHQQYKNDIAFGKLINVFCFLIIVIACLGLLGLASYETTLRKREVGIRKALGASVSQVLLLLSKEVVLLLVIAFAIALPVSYIIGQSWLANYSFHLEVELWMLLFPIVILLPLAFITVSSQTITTATTNPIESLRQE